MFSAPGKLEASMLGKKNFSMAPLARSAEIISRLKNTVG
jgi:hypothetical protein